MPFKSKCKLSTSVFPFSLLCNPHRAFNSYSFMARLYLKGSFGNRGSQLFIFIYILILQNYLIN